MFDVKIVNKSLRSCHQDKKCRMDVDVLINPDTSDIVILCMKNEQGFMGSVFLLTVYIYMYVYLFFYLVNWN